MVSLAKVSKIAKNVVWLIIKIYPILSWQNFKNRQKNFSDKIWILLDNLDKISKIAKNSSQFKFDFFDKIWKFVPG